MDRTSADYTVYSTRWNMLGMFCFLNLANAVLWVTFAPITDLASTYFDGASLTEINMLALIFQIGYVPGTVLGVVASKKYGMRNTLLIGGALDLIGSCIRLIGSIFRNELGAGGSYSLMMIGQLLASLAQPIYVNLPAGLASNWFSVDERDVATTIASLFNPVGSAIGQIIPAIIVYDDNGTIKGMTTLMLVEAIICAISLIIAYLYFKSKPPTPPSRSAFIKAAVQANVVANSNSSTSDAVINAEEVEEKLQEEISKHSEHSLFSHESNSDQPLVQQPGNDDSLDQLKKEFMMLMHNKDYVILLISFSVGLGLFNAFLTLIYQIIEPHGYSNDDAGTFAAILILFGLIGAGKCVYEELFVLYYIVFISLFDYIFLYVCIYRNHRSFVR